MSEQLSEKEQQLEHELEQAKQALDEARAEYERIEVEHDYLRKRQATAQALDKICSHLAELSQLEPLEDASPFTGESLSDESQRNQHYTGLVERIKTQVGEFRQKFSAAEVQLKEAEARLGETRKQVDKLSDELDKARPMVRTRTITRVDELGVERAFVVVYRRDALMPWAESPRDERRFKRTLVRTLVFMLLISLIMPWVPVPEIERGETVEIPDRIAQLVQERKPPPPPPPPPKLGEEKPKEAEKKKELKPRKQAPEPKTEVAKAAREKAQSSGLLAFSESFSDLMDNPAEEKLGKQARLTSGGETARRTERSLVTAAAAGRGSGGINTASLSRDVAGSGLSGRGTSRVTGVIGSEFGEAQRPLAESIRGSRTDEEIQLVFDRNKSALYSIYQRALRRDPTLKGKVVLKITIAPSGKVTAASVASSDLGDKALETKIAARVKLFNFGPKDVDTITITYPIDFLPA